MPEAACKQIIQALLKKSTFRGDVGRIEVPVGSAFTARRSSPRARVERFTFRPNILERNAAILPYDRPPTLFSSAVVARTIGPIWTLPTPTASLVCFECRP